jgi:hypothetical protein
MLKGVYEAKILALQTKECVLRFDSDTGRRKSLHTSGREEAKRIIRAKMTRPRNRPSAFPLPKPIWLAPPPKLVERTWAFVIQKFCAVKKESTRLRRELRREGGFVARG